MSQPATVDELYQRIKANPAAVSVFCELVSALEVREKQALELASINALFDKSACAGACASYGRWELAREMRINLQQPHTR